MEGELEGSRGDRAHVQGRAKDDDGASHRVTPLSGTQLEVLSHRCDNPLCQRVGEGHLVASTPTGNRREYLARRVLPETPPTSGGRALARSRRLRDRIRAGSDLRDKLRCDTHQLTLIPTSETLSGRPT